MSRWVCAVRGCMADFDEPEALVAHQVADHEYHQCRICDETVPAGFFALQHVFDEHTRAEYVRFYDGDSDAIRWRETIKDTIEGRVDLSALKNRILAEREPARAEAVE